MSKKQIMIFSCVAFLLVGALTIGRNATKAVRQDSHPQAHSSQQSPTAPDYVVYNFLFQKVVRLREKTTELQVQGRIGQKPYFPLQSEAGLTVSQATALEAIAFACRQQVRDQDEKAKAVIMAFRSSQFPGGRVPEGGAPPPPPELKTMQEERNAMILRARDQLRAAFGDEEFARFDNYAKFHYGTNTSPVTVNSVNPKATQK